MPAEAGIQLAVDLNNFKDLDSRFRWNDGFFLLMTQSSRWEAFAEGSLRSDLRVDDSRTFREGGMSIGHWRNLGKALRSHLGESQDWRRRQNIDRIL